MKLGEIIATANVFVAGINALLYILLLWLTNRYARSTDGILKITSTSAGASVFTWAYTLLSDKERIVKRRIVIEELPEYKGSLSDMPPVLRDAFEETCRSYDAVAIACSIAELSHETIAKEAGNSIIRSYEASERFIAELQQERGPMFWNGFRELYKEAKLVWNQCPRPDNYVAVNLNPTSKRADSISPPKRKQVKSKSKPTKDRAKPQRRKPTL